jgi:hypothetical protein
MQVARKLKFVSVKIGRCFVQDSKKPSEDYWSFKTMKEKLPSQNLKAWPFGHFAKVLVTNKPILKL